jgi:hypothetical protein
VIKSLSLAANFVPGDVMRIEPALVYQPEDIVIGTYTFLPWVRSGFAAGLTSPTGDAVRAQLTASINVEDDASSAPKTISKTLEVRGPGDILDFDISQITRRYPRPGTPNAEDTFLAHVEFDRPDFPWLFSPFKAQGDDRIPPWIALVVLEQSHAFIRRGGRGLPLIVETRVGELQSLTNSWAWAHAQVIGGTADPGPTVADRLTSGYGAVNLSRLICPRPLSAKTSYVACIVPAFEAGVRAGLGQSGGKLVPAWTRTANDDNQEIVLPVYDRWTFGTTDDGDFRSLAERLVGTPAPWAVGRRIMDASRPRGDVGNLAPGDPGRVQVIKCALVAPSTIPKPPDAPDENAAWNAAKTEELRIQVNLADTLSTDEKSSSDLLIGPTLYARFQRGQNNVAATPNDWFPELNLLPVRRVVAGLGTRVVQKDREQLMQAAWEQVGEMEATNRDVRRAQFARFVGASLHARHFSALPDGDLAQLTRGVQGKVRLGGSALTVSGTVANSAVAPSALTGAFRRMSRPQGPLARYVTGGTVAALQQIVATGDVFRDFCRPYAEPDGVETLSSSAVRAVSPEAAANVLGVPPKDALTELSKQTAKLNSLPSAADQLLSDPATWKPTKAAFDIGAIAAERTLTLVNAFMPASITEEPSRAEGLATVLTGIANSRTAAAKTAEDRVAAISKALPVRTAGAPLAAPGAAKPAKSGVASVLQQFDSFSSRRLGMTLATSRTITSAELTSSLSQFVRGVGTAELPLTPSRPPLKLARDFLLVAVHSRATVSALIKARIGTFPAWLAKDWFDDGLVRPIMAAPIFTRPMYEALNDYDQDWLIPGLAKIAQTDFVTVLETNPVFTEAFLVGLSDEMGHELLFRGFPTDQRGTYFRRFWNADADELGQDIHRFTRTPLGTHLTAAAGGDKPRLVFVVRGELIRRYPDALTFAMRAVPNTSPPSFIAPTSTNGALAKILFHDHLPPDILLVGFDLTEADLPPEGKWWFVIAEHPTAPRFGYPPNIQAVGFITTGNAASIAQKLLRPPVRAAFEASKLVTSTK